MCNVFNHTMRAGSSLVCLVVLSALLLLATGCGGSRQVSHSTRSTLNVETLSRVAVLPFENLSDHKFAGEKMRRALIGNLVNRGVDVIEPGEVAKKMRFLRIRSVGLMSIADVQALGRALNVDFLFTGSVSMYAANRMMRVTYAEVTAHFMLINAFTGDVDWSMWRTGGGPSFWTRHFGAEGKTLSEIHDKVVREALDELFD